MEVSPKFLRFAAVCAFVTAFTTLAVHLLPQLWADADTFEKQLDLRNRAIYMARLWIVIVHCFLVVVSMFATGLLAMRAKPAWATLGFLGFFVFAFAEILRTSLWIFAINRTLRTKYVATPDAAARGAIRAMIDAFWGVNDALFFIFIAAFFLGLVCYGVALISGPKSDAVLGLVFLAWAVLSLPNLMEAITGAASLSKLFAWVGYGFQPIARAWIGVWLWKRSSISHRE